MRHVSGVTCGHFNVTFSQVGASKKDQSLNHARMLGFRFGSCLRPANFLRLHDIFPEIADR
jgi:hypothetical protein